MNYLLNIGIEKYNSTMVDPYFIFTAMKIILLQ